jgi:glucuronoarabinoxylan endo-1,4-beta-xylanase
MYSGKTFFNLKWALSLAGFIIISSQLGCNKKDNEISQTFILQVNNGSGSGSYPPDRVITIAAYNAQDGQRFDTWTGDSDLLDHPDSNIATLTMPSRNVLVTATYKTISLGAPVILTIDKSVKYQTIDGFGFFGAYDVWWGNSTDMWNDAWGDKIISDLGITIWRNEYYPASTPGDPQDADWNKQKQVVRGLKTAAAKYGANLKYIFSVWSPPADLKWQSSFTWAGDPNATRNAGPVSTKNGGTLNPDKYAEYADWLKQGIQLYKDEGVDLYALSLQNEPMFTQTYNSCTYTTTWYNDLLINVVPKIREAYPSVKIFGSENMLDMEGANINWPYFYHNAIKMNPTASGNIDILAVHGYSDGISPTSGSGLAERWTNHREQFSGPLNRQAWMTETSGYADTWLGTADKPGAFNLAQDIYAGLYYGNMSAWVWWQGSQLDGIGDYNLMKGTSAGKKYYASKHFYRFIRPGAVRVNATSTEPESIFITSFTHDTNGTLSIIVINSGAKDRLVKIEGSDLPANFDLYRTTAGEDNCNLIGKVYSGNDSTFLLPARSIITLQSGGNPL